MFSPYRFHAVPTGGLSRNSARTRLIAYQPLIVIFWLRVNYGILIWSHQLFNYARWIIVFVRHHHTSAVSVTIGLFTMDNHTPPLSLTCEWVHSLCILSWLLGLFSFHLSPYFSISSSSNLLRFTCYSLAFHRPSHSSLWRRFTASSLFREPTTASRTSLSTRHVGRRALGLSILCGTR